MRAVTRSISNALGVVLLASLATATSSVQAADDGFAALRDAYSRVIASSDIAATYTAMINFAAEPNISSSTLWIDNGQQNDDKLKVTKLPLRYEFDLTGRGWKPFVQATLANLTLDETISLLGTEQVKSEWTSYSATLGGGVRIPLAEGWSVLPAMDFGYASLSNDVKYTGPIGNTFLRPLFDQILFDWSADAWLANGHLAVNYLASFRKLDIDATLSGTLSHIESFRTTTDLQTFRKDFGTLSFKIDGAYPLGVSVGGAPLSVVGHLGSSTFVGGKRDTLGFPYINEAGVSLQADISKHHLLASKLSLGAMGLWGDNVKGWSLLLGYKF